MDRKQGDGGEEESGFHIRVLGGLRRSRWRSSFAGRRIPVSSGAAPNSATSNAILSKGSGSSAHGNPRGFAGRRGTT
jgi:hypothetical protein